MKRYKHMKRSLFLISFLFFGLMSLKSLAQDSTLNANDSLVYVSGVITDQQGIGLGDLMVVNRSTGQGVFGEGDGSFLVKIKKGDELQFGAFGYTSYRVSFKDSAYKKQYNIKVSLQRLRIELAEAQVIAPRQLRDIIADIEELGYNEKDYKVSGVDALSSPITFLYETFSKREQSKREAFSLENRDRRRELLRELFIKYVEYDIISLDDDEFDDFIAYCDPGDERLKRWTQYEFILYVKERFIDFKSIGKKMKDSDFEYHLDDK